MQGQIEKRFGLFKLYMNPILTQFGDIDIYLFDQLLKGRFLSCKKIIDLGCGRGRNLIYFLQNEHEVYGLDNSPAAIAELQALAAKLAPSLPKENFQVAAIDHQMPFEKESFDLLICNAVLHFADNEQHFEEMLFAAWSLLKPGGYFFARLATDIGMEGLLEPLENGHYLLPDGSERFLATEEMLLHYTKVLNAEPFEFLKTTQVQNLRAMTTWCLQK